MNFPNFEDFSDTITKDVLKGIAEEINRGKIVVNGSNLDETVNSILGVATASSAITTLELLRRYHEWLAQQLEK